MFWFQEHRKGCESGPCLPGGCVPVQPRPGPSGLPAPPDRPIRHDGHPPAGRWQRCQLSTVRRASDTEDPRHAEEGESYFPVKPALPHFRDELQIQDVALRQTYYVTVLWKSICSLTDVFCFCFLISVACFKWSNKFKCQTELSEVNTKNCFLIV